MLRVYLLTSTLFDIQEYANIGLRTLTLASKKLDEKTYTEWKQKHYEASIALAGRDEKLHEVYEEIEVIRDVTHCITCYITCYNT